MFDALVKNTVAPLLLRAALAAVFIFHGYHKMSDTGNEWGAAWMKAGTANNPEPPGKAVQLAVAWGELLGGIALGLGFLTRLAALGIIAIMAGAIATVRWPNFGGDHGYEYNMLIIAACAVLVLTGGGALAADRVFRRQRRQ